MNAIIEALRSIHFKIKSKANFPLLPNGGLPIYTVSVGNQDTWRKSASI